jgi:hypothetical protein
MPLRGLHAAYSNSLGYISPREAHLVMTGPLFMHWYLSLASKENFQGQRQFRY